MRQFALVAFILFFIDAPALAQTPTFTEPSINNPSAITFTPSNDHATIDSYELDIMRPDNTILQTLNIGKPIPNASNVCTASINVQPIVFNVGYYIRLRAVAGVAKSDDTTSLNPFNRVPGGPSKVIIK